MNISKFSNFCVIKDSFSDFKVLPLISHIDRRILTLASVILALLGACFLVSRFCKNFKFSNSNKDLSHKNDLLHSKNVDVNLVDIENEDSDEENDDEEENKTKETGYILEKELSSPTQSSPPVVIDIRDDQGRTPLQRALYERESASVIENFLKEGADPNAIDSTGNTCLHYLVMENSQKFFYSVDIESAKVLLHYGAKIDQPNLAGNTPLHLAIRTSCSKDVIQFFLDNKASPNSQNQMGETPLNHLACYNHFDIIEHEEITQQLIASGADANSADAKGNLPIHKAYERGGSKIIDLLLAKTLDHESANSKGETVLHLEALNSDQNIDRFKQILDNSKNIMAQDIWGNTALHYTVGGGVVEATQMILDKIASDKSLDVNIANLEGKTPLHRAVNCAFGRQLSSQAALENIGETIKLLHSAQKQTRGIGKFRFSKNFDYPIPDSAKTSIELLLDFGANPSCQTKHGESVIESCFKLGKMFVTFKTDDYFDKIRNSLIFSGY